MTAFFGDFCIHFEPLLGWKCSYVCRKKLTVKSEIKDKQLAYKWPHLKKLSSKRTFFYQTATIFLENYASIWNPR